ncbi:hypothetical protein [Chromohalobacter israelensis]
MRHDEMTELAEDLEELRDCLIDAAEGEAIPADAAMRGHNALDFILNHLESLADD